MSRLSLSRQAKLNGFKSAAKPRAPKPTNDDKVIPVTKVEPVVELVEVAVTKNIETIPEKVPGPAFTPPTPKVKRARYVRAIKEPTAQPTAPALPSRSTNMTGKLMTKGLALPPKSETPGLSPSFR